MKKPRIVFVVGHKNWGKSRTLRSLTNGNPKQRNIEIEGIGFFIRRMSNDDQPEGFLKFMESIDPDRKPLIIAALCPDFGSENTQTATILESLQKKGYELFFWVIEHNYKFPHIIVQPDEINKLKQLGKVKVFSENKEDSIRAKMLKQFISDLSLV